MQRTRLMGVLWTRLMGVLSALLMTGLLAACSTGSPSATGTPAVQVEPTGTLITGHAGCWEDRTASPAPDTGSGDVRAIACRQIASDPRFTGTKTAIGTFIGNGEVVTAWGPATVETADGGWQCDELVMMSERNHVGWNEGVCTGRVGTPYEGLTAYLHATTADGGETWGFIGWIDESE